MTSISLPARTAGVFAVLLYGLLLSACVTQGVRLSEADRASLANQPAIQLLHYETPLPDIKTGSKIPPPAAFDVRKHAAADPAALIALSFSRLLVKKEKIKNLHVETRHLPRPVAPDAHVYREKYRHGLVLELWVDEWTFSPLTTDTKTYLMMLSARSRLARVEDGRILWSTGRCTVGGNTASNRDMRLAGTELTEGARLRKLLAMARDECTRQLLRDFDARGVEAKK
jgi:hypothetical protein